MNTNGAGSLFWFFTGIIVSFASYRLGLGTVSEPGTGFMPFGAGLLLALLSLVSFAQTAVGKREAKGEPLFRGTFWLKVVLAFAALLAYAQALPFGGYNITTFLLMLFLFGIVERQKVWKIAAYSLIATAVTYYVFSKGLNLQFPAGPFGF